MLANNSLFPTFFHSFLVQKETERSPFENLTNLKDLASTLTSASYDLDQWMNQKKDIRAFIAKHAANLEQLDEFFTAITDWGMERNPQKTLAVLIEIVSLDILTKVVISKQQNTTQPFTNIFDLAVENTDCPEPVDTSLKTKLSLEWRRFRPIILYFIPNVINIFLGAFNFLNSQKKYTTLWDKHLLVEIVYKFCLIPYFLVKVLQPVFVVTTKVYVIAALIIVGIGVLISCYQRWFKPLPDEIVHCTNLDKQMERGIVDLKVGQIKEVRQLIAALAVDSNVILIGRSGEGKTALIHHFIQLKQKGELPEKLQSLRVYAGHSGRITDNVSYGHAEIISQIRDDIEGFEDRALFFFDEFYQIVSNKAAFRAFKEKFLGDKPLCKCIVAVSLKEWDELKKVDIDYSFRRRMHRIVMSSSSDDQIRKMIKSMEYGFAPDVPVTQDAVEAMIKISAREHYLPDIGRAAKVEEIFKNSVGLCRAAYHHHYDKELNEEELETTRKQIQKIKKIIAHQQKIKINHASLSHLFSKAIAPKEYVEDPAIDLNRLKNVNILDMNNTEEKEPIAPAKESFSEKDQIMYLWYHFYAMKSIERILNREIAKVDDEIPLQVSPQLVNRVYEEISRMENPDYEEVEEEDDE